MGRPKKAHFFRIKTFRNRSGTHSWRVTGTGPDGKHVRQNFADKTEAMQKLADLEAEAAGTLVSTKLRRTRMSEKELAAAESAILAASGRDLSDLVTHYLTLESRAKAKGIDLNAALSFVEAHYRSEIQSITVFNARAEFIESRNGTAPKTRDHYGSCLKLLLKPDPNRHVHSFVLADIEKILNRYRNANSKRTYARAFGTFFKWCMRRRYCLENPCDHLDRLPSDMSQIARLSLEETTRLLAAAMRYQDGVAVAPIAIGLFAGLRPSEIADLKPKNLLREKIRVEGGKMRRTLKRSVPIPPVLAKWLKEYPFTGLPDGWEYKLRKLRDATKPQRWVQDIIRHTSITFQTERDKNEALTAYNNGTSKAMMDRHYRDVIDEDEVVSAFWDLTPAKVRKAKLQVELPAKRKVDWPSKPKLKKLVWEKPLVHAAADLGVSDVALKKHCVKLGIELPPRGHWLRG